MRINYIKEISIKNDAKKKKIMKDYQISKINIALNYCKLSAYSLAMITKFVQMSINKSMILRYKEFSIKATTFDANFFYIINYHLLLF